MDERFVSIIIPCRNEERFIGKCLKSIFSQDYPKGGSRSSASSPLANEFERSSAELSLPPKGKLEVLVVDGMSTDGTRKIIENWKLKIGNLKLLDNPKIITPSAMNIGIQEAKGEIIIKVDAHSVYEKDYVSKCVEHLIESGADNVGGVLRAVPSRNTLIAKAIAISLSHFFGAAGSYFRTGTDKPREVDTVAFGCYWKKTFDKIGLYDERMAQIEDLELNYRLKKAGGKIMLFPDVKALYYPSSDNLVSFFKHNFTDGIWATYPLKYGFKVSLRHLVPLVFVLTLPLSIWPYILSSLFFSAQVAAREKDLRLFFVMPLIFGARHLGYGLGSLAGFLKLLCQVVKIRPLPGGSENNDN